MQAAGWPSRGDLRGLQAPSRRRRNRLQVLQAGSRCGAKRLPAMHTASAPAGWALQRLQPVSHGPRKAIVLCQISFDETREFVSNPRSETTPVSPGQIDDAFQCKPVPVGKDLVQIRIAAILLDQLNNRIWTVRAASSKASSAVETRLRSHPREMSWIALMTAAWLLRNANLFWSQTNPLNGPALNSRIA